MTPIIFLYILTVKERYNPLDRFCMGIIVEISFFFFAVEDPACNQKLCAEICWSVFSCIQTEYRDMCGM